LATPVHLFSGFLGAGKTSAIRAQLAADPSQNVAVIVNDFGEASLDEVALSEESPFQITNIPGGCVCCTAPEGFVDALGAVLERRPDRLIIEPTGLARPQDLIDTIRRCPYGDELEIAPVVVLIAPRQLDVLEGEEAQLLDDQAQVADVLVANHTDLCDPEQIERFEKFADALWPAPLAIHLTQNGELPPDALAWPDGQGPRATQHSHAAHPHAEPSTDQHRARSFQYAPHVVFSRARLDAALRRALAGEAGAPLARLKGIFRTQEGTTRLEVAGGSLHENATAYRRDSRVDAIVRADDESALDTLEAWLDEAVLDASELALDVNRIEFVLPDARVLAVDRERLEGLPEPMLDVSTKFPKRVGTAARVRPLLQALGIPEEGEAVVVAGDGFASEPVAMEVFAEGVVLHSLEGEPLPDDQGGPFRLLIPEEASPEPVACANVKGIAKVVVRDA
jgi:G3E family GTPase